MTKGMICAPQPEAVAKVGAVIIIVGTIYIIYKLQIAEQQM